MSGTTALHQTHWKVWWLIKHATYNMEGKMLCYLIITMPKVQWTTLTKFSSMTKSPISSVISMRWLWARLSVRNSWSLKNVAGRVHSLLWLRFRWVNLARHPNSAGILSRLLLCIWVQYHVHLIDHQHIYVFTVTAV